MLLNLAFGLALLNMANVRAGRVLLALYALKFEASPFAVGVLAATFSALPMLLSWPAGRMSDRFGSRWLLVSGAVFGATGMLVPYFFASLWSLYVAAGMIGLSFTFYTVTLQNLVGVLSNAENRARNFSTFSLVLALAGFIGPVLAGLSIDHAGFTLACLWLTGLSIIPLVMLTLWGARLPGGEPPSAAADQAPRALVEPGLVRVLAISSLVVSGIDLFQFYLPIYGHEIGMSPSAIGLVLAMFSAAAFVVRAIMPRLLERLTAERVLTYAFYVAALSFLLVPLFKSAILLALLSFTFGLGMGCGQPITMMLTFSNAASGRSGETLGLRLTVNHLTRVVCPVLFGAIGSAFGLFAVFWVNALMLGAGGFLTRVERADAPAAESRSD